MMNYFAPATINGRAYFAPDASPALSSSIWTDLAGSYAVRASLVADLAGSYSVIGAAGKVAADLVGTYSVRTAAGKDQVFAFGVRGRVIRDLAGAFQVLAATDPSEGASSPPITVPETRTAQFASRSRVIVFSSPAPMIVPKAAADELFCVGDFSRDLDGSATTAKTVTPVLAGVTLLEGPSIQGNLIVVKLGGFDTAPGARNFFTFRVTCVNGEQFDRTIEFTEADDRSWVFGKDPDDKLLYAFDLSADATFGGSAPASFQAPEPAGISALSAPVIQGSLVIVKIGGLDQSDGATNSYGLTILFANGEKIKRTIYFEWEEH